MVENRQITLQDIAELLKVTKVTVSKALRDHPDISPETKVKVKKTAEKLGYTPNLIARNLSSRKTNTIGLVVPKIAHHFFADVIESIYQRAYQRNYDIILTVSQENVENELKHLSTLMAMKVDGVLISVTENTRDIGIFDVFRKRKVPLVFLDRIMDQGRFSSVATDDVGGAYAGINRLLNEGFTRIGHLAGYNHISIGLCRKNGFMKAMREKGAKINPDWILEGGFSEADGYKSFKKLIKQGALPEVLFAVTYSVALGALQAAQEMRIRIPEQIKLFSFGGPDYSQLFKPSIGYIDQPAKELGKQAFDLLYGELADPYGIDPQHIKVATSFVKSING